MKNMVYSIHQMYTLAQARAIGLGPRLISLDGVWTAGYILTKTELKALFREHGYNTATRRAWLNCIDAWKDYDALIPKSFYEEPEQSWAVAFNHVGNQAMIYLRSIASDKCVPYYPPVIESAGANA